MTAAESTPSAGVRPVIANAAVYELTGVSKRYLKQGAEIMPLRDVNLVIPRGEFVTVQGPTGGGKSTLLQLLGALDSPTSGTVSFDGMVLSGASAAQLTEFRRDHLGFVFQSFNLLPTLTAEENVWVALEHLRLSPTDRAQRAKTALERVGLGDRGTHFPHELSGGQQQRVAIARAMVAEPEVLLADEPTGNLDEAMRDEVLDLLRELNEGGLTIIAVTHDSAVAARAHRRLVLKNGTVREQ